MDAHCDISHSGRFSHLKRGMIILYNFLGEEIKGEIIASSVNESFTYYSIYPIDNDGKRLDNMTIMEDSVLKVLSTHNSTKVIDELLDI